MARRIVLALARRARRGLARVAGPDCAGDRRRLDAETADDDPVVDAGMFVVEPVTAVPFDPWASPPPDPRLPSPEELRDPAEIAFRAAVAGAKDDLQRCYRSTNPSQERPVVILAAVHANRRDAPLVEVSSIRGPQLQPLAPGLYACLLGVVSSLDLPALDDDFVGASVVLTASN